MNSVLPSAMWLPFGARILRERSAVGVSREELAATVGVSGDKLQEVEDARCRPARTLVERVDTALGTGQRLVEAWATTLQAEAFPSEFGDLREVERHAACVWEHQPMALPVFLRTRDYARAVLAPRYPNCPPERIDRLVEEQMASRSALTRPGGPRLRVVLNESVLQRPQGGARVLNDQRDFLADLVKAGIVDLGVIPESTADHPGLAGAFRVMEFTDRPSLVYAFGAGGGDLTADAEEIRQCETLRESIEAAACALTPASELLTARWPRG